MSGALAGFKALAMAQIMAGPTAGLMLNRDKRGLALNLEHPRGCAVLFKLVRKSDALIENFRKGTLEKFGAADTDELISDGVVHQGEAT